MKKGNWSELRVLLRENFKFSFYNNINKWGRTIKVSVSQMGTNEDNFIKFINDLGYENVNCRKHVNGPFEYVMIDIKN